MSAVETKLISWEASDGYPFLYRITEPRGDLRGHVVTLHGIQSHSGWYDRSTQSLAEAGYCVHYLDRRGSGLNFRQRGDTPSGQRLLQDVIEYLRELIVSSEPIFLSACSWGGKVAALVAAATPSLAGLILIAPGFFPKVSLPLRQKLAIARSRLFRPTRPFPIPLNDPALFTNQPERQRFIAQDPLALHWATARFFIESVRLDRRVMSEGPTIRIPVLLQLAGHDDIIDAARTWQFVDTWAARDRTVRLYSDGYHTLEFDADPSSFIADQIRWLDGHLPAAT